MSIIELKRDVYEDMVHWKESKTGRALIIRGPRQVGKSYIAGNFAREHYAQSFYIDMAGISGQKFLKCCETLDYLYVSQLFKKYSSTFRDSYSTVVIIDNIQESEFIRSCISGFAGTLQSNFIIIETYLDGSVGGAFSCPAGTADIVDLYTLSFPEFLDAFGKRDLYYQISLFGESKQSDYDEIWKYFDLYCQIGGYPSVVKTYLKTKDLSECRREIAKIIKLGNANLIDKVCLSTALSLVRKRVEPRVAISKEDGNNSGQIIDGYTLPQIIRFCETARDCNYLKVEPVCQFYFCDLGIAAYYLKRTGVGVDIIKSILIENLSLIHI